MSAEEFTLSPRRVLAFEAEWLNRPQHDGRKATAVRARFGVSETRYYQALNQAIGLPSAVAEYSIVVRVIRARQDRVRRRGGGS